MKKLILLTVAIVFTSATMAQKLRMDKIYVQLGSEALEVKSIFNNKWAITASTMGFYGAEPTLPSDYIARKHDNSAANFFLFILSLGMYDPSSSSDTYRLKPLYVRFSHISFGRFYPLTRSLSITADAGIGLATTQKYVFTKNSFSNKLHNEYYGYSNNYDITAKNHASVGGIVRAGFDWAFSSFAGLGLDAFYNFNAGGIKSYSGANVKLMVGWMNRPPKKMKTWN